MSDSSNGASEKSSPAIPRQVFMDRVRVDQDHRRFKPGEPDRYVQASTTLIAAVLILGVLYIGSGLFVPVAVSLLAYLTLRPAVAKLCRQHVPQAAATGIVIAGLFITLGVITSLLYSPAQQWMRTAPENLVKVRDKFRDLAQPLTTIDRADKAIEEATLPVRVDRTELTVEVEKPSMVDESALINQTGQWLAFIAAIAVLTFFMLSTGDDLLNRLLGVLPNETSRDEVLGKIADIQSSVGTYLAQITCINTGLGLAVTIVMWLLGMPTPVLWGVLATLFNFIPYVGPLAATAIVFLAASSSFDTIGRASVTALAFWLTTAIEGQLVTPAILGKTLKVGPVVVLIAVAFWGFLWGLPGVFLAVPLLIVQRKVFASFDKTYPLSVVLGEDPCRSGQDCEPVKEDQPIAEMA